jgi:nucleotide-binding universal stress UspA family protein
MSRVLVVANETVEAEELRTELRRIEDEHSSTFLVVAPAVAAEHGLGTWSQAGAIEAAQERLDHALTVLRGEGLECEGYVGDMVPFAAVRDALDRFDATMIVISTHPATRSGWLRKDLVDQVRSTFKLPVVHVISHVRERRTA